MTESSDPTRGTPLWQGRFGDAPAEELLDFTESLSFDARLVADDLAGSRAHVDMLARVGLINDDERGLHHDYGVWLEKLAPHEPVSGYRHNDTGEDNADAHMKRQVMGREVVVAVTDGRLDFGPWEQIFYSEFDGRRNKRVLVKIIGE